jgi:hypothetical protein
MVACRNRRQYRAIESNRRRLAEGMGLISNLLLWMQLGLQGISDRLGM